MHGRASRALHSAQIHLLLQLFMVTLDDPAMLRKPAAGGERQIEVSTLERGQIPMIGIMADPEWRLDEGAHDSVLLLGGPRSGAQRP
jgi:hypothetical protein